MTITLRKARNLIARNGGELAYCVGYGDRPTLRNPTTDHAKAIALAASKGEGFRVIPVVAYIERNGIVGGGFCQQTGRLVAVSHKVQKLIEIAD